MTEEERGNYSSEKEIEIQIEIQTYVNSELIRNKQRKKIVICVYCSLSFSQLNWVEINATIRKQAYLSSMRKCII